MKLNKPRVNVFLGEWAGWTFRPSRPGPYTEQEKEDGVCCWVPPGRPEWQPQLLPNFCDSLDEIHGILNPELEILDGQFYSTLEDVIGRDRGVKIRGMVRPGFSAWIAHATPSQLAEAFIIHVLGQESIQRFYDD